MKASSEATVSVKRYDRKLAMLDALARELRNPQRYEIIEAGPAKRRL